MNIASRLQTVAMGGSTCISQEVYARVADWIHANDLGALQIKGVRDPVHAWEPTEAALGMPPDLDPFKRGGRRDAAPRADAHDSAPSRSGVESFATAMLPGLPASPGGRAARAPEPGKRPPSRRSSSEAGNRCNPPCGARPRDEPRKPPGEKAEKKD